MMALAAKIAGRTGHYRRVGSSTTFEIRKQVGGNRMIVLLTVTVATIKITGDIQPGLEDVFREHWDRIKALTPDSEPEYQREMFFDHRIDYFVYAHYGGGYKPNFEINVHSLPDFRQVVRLIFKVNIQEA